MKKIIIIGEKNVGKSSLFNILTKSNSASVINYPGYTRDINKIFIKLNNFVFEIIDTAGIGYEKTNIDFFVFKKTWEEIKNVDLIIVLSDIFNFDKSINKNIINILKNFKQKKINVINKSDLLNYEDVNNYLKKNLFLISVKKNFGIKKLINLICNYFNTDASNDLNFFKKFSVSVVGKINSGKSSLVNKLIGYDKMLVFNENGTTRDNIRISILGKKYDVIDTPGIKNINNVKDKLGFFQIKKNSKIFDFSGISILNIDITKEITKNDLLFIKKKNINVIVLNKCDLVDKKCIMKTESLFKDKFKINKSLVYIFLSSKYNFGINNLFRKLNNIIFIYNKLLSYNEVKFLNLNSFIVSKFSDKFGFVEIEKIYPLKIKVFLTNKKFSSEYKKFITFLIIKELNLNGVFFSISFF